MTRDLDSLTTAHRIADERRKAGQPSWKSSIDLRDYATSIDMPHAERCTGIAARIAASTWYREDQAAAEKDGVIESELAQMVDELKDADDEEHLHLVMSQVYDLADVERVRILTS